MIRKKLLKLKPNNASEAAKKMCNLSKREVQEQDSTLKRSRRSPVEEHWADDKMQMQKDPERANTDKNIKKRRS